MSNSLVPFKPGLYLLPPNGAMRVPGLIVATQQQLLSEELEKPLEQVRNVATLPGIVGYSIAMPDMHWGYGFPIGGVAAMDLQTGVISPGGIGYDINCGVRLAVVPLAFQSLDARTRKALLNEIFHSIPSGTGQGHKREKTLSDADYKELLIQGAAWSVHKGMGVPQDLEQTESNGVLAGADFAAVSQEARLRGRSQVGSIGSGNHFIEIGEIQKVVEPTLAAAWGIEKGQTYILIHSGSRGFGHQVCQDFLNDFIQKGFAKNLPDRQLVAAPIMSSEGKQYWAAMAAAANFAFNNRQQILHFVRLAFQKVCRLELTSIRLLYDVCHNIGKIETHLVEGKATKLLVHRKGATRAYGPGSPELTPLFRTTGQPVLVPGDMGRASYLMVGLGNPLTWCSACHGAGRAHSRIHCLQAWKGKRPLEHMASLGVQVMAHTTRTIAEEMPDAYKDVDRVIEAVEEARLAQAVARLRPYLVLKG